MSRLRGIGEDGARRLAHLGVTTTVDLAAVVLAKWEDDITPAVHINRLLDWVSGEDLDTNPSLSSSHRTRIVIGMLGLIFHRTPMEAAYLQALESLFAIPAAGAGGGAGAGAGGGADGGAGDGN